jgi:hypothetical protein
MCRDIRDFDQLNAGRFVDTSREESGTSPSTSFPPPTTGSARLVSRKLPTPFPDQDLFQFPPTSMDDTILNFSLGSQNLAMPDSSPFALGSMYFDFPSTYQILAGRMPQDVALSIADGLQRHCHSTMARITGLKATVVYQLGDGGASWPVVEWREGDETDVVAIFKVEDATTPCGYLMHRGVGCWRTDGRRWRQSFLAWLVSNIAHLKELFQAAQHIFGILQWSNADLLTLYCEKSPRIGSDEE